MANISIKIKDWSAVAASNQPDGTDASTIKGDLQSIQAAVRNLYSQDTIASASTCDLGAKDAESLTISGVVTITSFGTVSAGIVKRVLFSGSLVLTYNATSLILPSSTNITTSAGDTAELESLGAGNWRCNWYQKQSGLPTATTGLAQLSGANFTGAINEARGTVAMHATTMDLWAQPNTIDGTGSAVTITAIANAPQAGAKRTLYPITGTVITNGATFAVDGNADYTAMAGDGFVFEAVTTSTYKVHITKKDGTSVVGSVKQIQPITASVAANALTITLNPTSLDFRSATLGSGTVNTRAVNSAISTTISSGSTGGTVSGVQSRMAVLCIDDIGSGNRVVGWTNLAGGVQLNETNLITTTAEGGAGGADSANVIYTTVAVTTPSPYRVVGYVESTQATAGTWATAPSTIQGYGGQALAAMSSLGYGQTWQNVTGSRALGTTYYNTTGKPIVVSVYGAAASGSPQIIGWVNGVSIISTSSTASSLNTCLSFVVPSDNSYSITQAIATWSMTVWSELR